MYDFVLMIRVAPESTRTDTLLPDSTVFRSKTVSAPSPACRAATRARRYAPSPCATRSAARSKAFPRCSPAAPATSIITARPRCVRGASSATPPGSEPHPHQSTRDHAGPRPRRQWRDRRRRPDALAPSRRPPPLQAAHHGPPDDHGAQDLRQPARAARRAPPHRPHPRPRMAGRACRGRAQRPGGAAPRQRAAGDGDRRRRNLSPVPAAGRPHRTDRNRARSKGRRGHRPPRPRRLARARARGPSGGRGGSPRLQFRHADKYPLMRRWIFGLLALLLMAAAAFFLLAPGIIERGVNKVEGGPLPQVGEQARALHRTLAIVDLHSDTLLWKRDLLTRAGRGHVDLPRLEDEIGRAHV